MVAQFKEVGFTRASQGAGPTVSKYGFEPCAADHIFTRGMEVFARGAILETKASDHHPLWVTLAPASE
jgi:endonuclease/exonuclease/phosphatase (EEP) superfamily protein YafD